MKQRPCFFLKRFIGSAARRIHQKALGAAQVAVFLSVRRVTWRDARPIEETKALKENSVANKATSIAGRDYLSVVVVNVYAVFENDLGVSFLTAFTTNIVEDIMLPDFLTGNSPQTYQCYILDAKFPLRVPNILNTIEDISEEDM